MVSLLRFSSFFSFQERGRESSGGDVLCQHGGLQQSDFVMVVVNLSPATQKLIGAKELAMMKPTSTLINISRGMTRP